ncbi:hypothetical protein G6Y98_02835 [Clostridium perfringens]|uniref:hypothetical protein n=1 Tax=Clostridium perfringens TaxID=1502 RepID=UPI0013E288C9|nr:hypothetical protein [Clostridium perfringens]ELU5587706.1 hypothetical protein [Clostridium perfringens]MDU3844810.1 hypothetical protein [Clostridium perfringens]NGT58454.1 hypothetical protein [Clostridium perfringens]NGT94750.1 hypothetical protein [Clostridium perfringens]
MKKNILGEYNFSNSTSINFIDNDEEEINSTILHETIHMLLTRQTAWGIACYLIRKVSIYDSNYSHILGELCTHSRKVQEATAVFSECIYIIKNKGYDEYLRYLQYLKTSNKVYYKYIVNLIKFLKLLEPKNQIRVDVDELNFLIMTLSQISLNVDITEIEIEIFQKKKLFKKFISNAENVNKYIPNKRFNILLKKYYSIIKQHGELKINNIVNNLNEDMRYNCKINEEYFIKIKNYFKQLYRNSNRINEISTYFETTKLVEVDIEDLPKYSVPQSFSTFQSYKSCYEDILNYCECKIGILFYYGNVIDIESFDSSLVYIPKEYMEIIKNKFGEKSHMISYFDYINQKIFDLNVSESQFKKLMEVNELTVVVNYKVYDIEKDDIKGVNTENKSIFIYCDRTYHNSINLINSIAKQKCKARIINYNNMYLLIIRVSDKTKFILPFMGIVYLQLIEDVNNGKLNIELADNQDKLTKTDDYILTTEKSVDEYDLIVNCLFQTE